MNVLELKPKITRFYMTFFLSGRKREGYQICQKSGRKASRREDRFYGKDYHARGCSCPRQGEQGRLYEYADQAQTKG